MRVIPLFVLLFFLSSCIDERFFDSLGDQVKSVIDKANQTGGGGGIAILNKEISKLEKKLESLKEDVTEKEDELAQAEDDLDETEEELEEIQERLDEIKERLENDESLSPEERQALEQERDGLREDKSELEEERNALRQEKTRLEGEVQRANSRVTEKESEITALENEKSRLLEQIASLEDERNTARGERDTARGERDTARGALRTAQEERDCWRKTRDNICDRTDEVEDAIMSVLSDIDNCNDVNYCDLEEITNLDLSSLSARGPYDPADDDLDCADYSVGFQAGDFAGFTNLLNLNLSGNCLKYFQTPGRGKAILSGLEKIQNINLQDTGIEKLPVDFIDNIRTTIEEILVTDFIACNKQSHSALTAVLGPSGDVTRHDDHEYSSVPNMERNYCIE